MKQTRGWTLWLTGVPASGKTSLARRVCALLAEQGMTALVLDSDELRPILTPATMFTPAERDKFYRRLVDLAQLLAGKGLNVIIAATGNRRAYREYARHLMAPFAEVWVRCPIEVCRSRDPKHLYAMADAGEIAALPGVGVGYEEPLAPDVTVDTNTQTLDEAAEQIIERVPFILRSVARSQ